MSHIRDSSPGDDLYKRSLLTELEAAEPSAPVGASAAFSPEEGEGVAEVMEQMDLVQILRVIFDRKLLRILSRALSIKRQGNVPSHWIPTQPDQPSPL